MPNKMVLAKIAAVVALCFAFVGCAGLNRLPLVNAESFEYARSGVYSSTAISAVNVHVTETEVTADSLDVTTSYPIVGSITVKITKYRRVKTP